MIAHIYFMSSIFFWQESENKINCMIDMRVREMDMNAFCCLYYFYLNKKMIKNFHTFSVFPIDD
jgi:hypothetical protein